MIGQKNRTTVDLNLLSSNKEEFIMTEPRYKNYRVCYTNGNPKTGIKLYELHKDCKCYGCQSRTRYRRQPSNGITVTTADISKVDEIAEFLKDWTCADGQRLLDTVYLRF